MGFSVETLVVGPIEENCYVLRDEETGHGLIIDPGDNGQEILAYIRDNQIKVDLLVNTHGHWDHIGAVDFLRDELDVKLAIHHADASMLTATREEMSSYSMFAEGKRPAEILLHDGDTVEFGNSSLQVIHTPGHTKGGICLYGGGCLFSGDTLFAGSVGRTDLPGGDYREILHSVRSKLKSVEDTVKVYPGHGPATNMGRERRCNPYLQEK